MRQMMAAIAVCFLLAAEDKSEASKKELEQQQGEWSMISGARDGQALPEDFVKSGKRIVKGDESTVTFGGQLFMKARVTLDPTKKPKTIDYTVLEGPNKGQVQLGIYELKGDTVKFCFAKDRPTDFTTKLGDGRTLSEWKKDKK